MARTWTLWLLGFVAGFVLAAYLSLTVLATHAQSAEVAAALRAAAVTYGVDEGCLRAIAWRESRFTPGIDNLQGSGAQGLMQFMPPTWRWMSSHAGYGGGSPYDPWAAAHVAAWAISHPYESQGGLRHWGGWC